MDNETRVKQILTGKLDLKSAVEDYLKSTRMDYAVSTYEDEDYDMIEVGDYIIGHDNDIFTLFKIHHIAGSYYDPPDQELKPITEGKFYAVMKELSLKLIDDAIQEMKERDYEDSI